MLLRSAATAVAILGPTVSAFAQEGAEHLIPAERSSSPLLKDNEPGHGSLTFQVMVYNHADGPGDGNPFLDEDLTVIEPVIIFDYDVSETFGFGVTLSYDYVSSASIDRLSDFPDQSGASADNYFGGDLSFRHRIGDGEFGWHVGGSTEYDYNSLGVGTSYTWQPEATDATVALSLDAYFDSIDIIRFDGTEDEGDDDRTSVTAQGNWYQILSPSSFGELGLSVAHQTGFLETPYNAVVVEDPSFSPNPNLDNNAQGEEQTEELPNDRTRVALFGRYRKRMSPGKAWQLGGRLYGDSWDVYSLTLQPSFIQGFNEGRIVVDYHYRFYIQTEARFFDDHVDLSEMDSKHRTQDSDLGDFNTNTLGFGVNWQVGERSSLNFGFDYAFRSDDLDYLYGIVGYTWGF